MLAVEFRTQELGYETAKGLFARRVMTAGTLVNAKTIRFEPTAEISEEDISEVISRLDMRKSGAAPRTLKDVSRKNVPGVSAFIKMQQSVQDRGLSRKQ